MCCLSRRVSEALLPVCKRASHFFAATRLPKVSNCLRTSESASLIDPRLPPADRSRDRAGPPSDGGGSPTGKIALSPCSNDNASVNAVIWTVRVVNYFFIRITQTSFVVTFMIGKNRDLFL